MSGVRIVDANGDTVPDVLAEQGADAAMAAWFAGRVPAADCPHYIAASEARAGFTTCERCPS